MTAMARLLAQGWDPASRCGCSPPPASSATAFPKRRFRPGLLRDPHLIGCDMGSIDLGPYLSRLRRHGDRAAITRRDLLWC